MTLESTNSAVLLVKMLPATARSRAGRVDEFCEVALAMEKDDKNRARKAMAASAKVTREASAPAPALLATPRSQCFALLWCSTCTCSM